MSIVSLAAGKVVLREWNILQINTPEGSGEIFVGYSEHDGLGRVSTVIQHFDETTKTGRTQSGSEYEVIGEAGMPHEDAMYVLERTLGADLIQKELLPGNSEVLRFRYPIK
ncbi:MAG TPA: hypothetical protein ENI26_13125 [Methylophaga aminisulfidivorans]|uniref:Uncharacterized protein n=1 Tax=Methylophaga aminisulfidivorans TaxID=230105 RepID=A0A7C2A8X4_9GAMM|nr:hypothetical protein [Methylophaga aminisulfidivorans]